LLQEHLDPLIPALLPFQHPLASFVAYKGVRTSLHGQLDQSQITASIISKEVRTVSTDSPCGFVKEAGTAFVV
jgi:hypothetical protein